MDTEGGLTPRHVCSVRARGKKTHIESDTGADLLFGGVSNGVALQTGDGLAENDRNPTDVSVEWVLECDGLDRRFALP